MRVAVTGASGLVGRALVPALEGDGHQVVRLVRRPASGPQERQWDPSAGRLDPSVVADTDAVVHLAGAGVGDQRWTKAYKAEILDSRVLGTSTVATALAQVAASGGPRVLLSASAVGWYGNTGDRVTDESGPPGQGFLAEVCRQWEGATRPAQDAGVRVAHLRTGLVQSGAGGALPRQVRIWRLGLGAPLGSGRQWWSWISLDDEVAAIRHLLQADVEGPVNLVGPQPVTNREYTKVLGRVVRRPTLPVPVPGAVLTVLLGEFAQEGGLYGQRLVPAVLDRTGFRFTHRDLESALRATL